MSVTVTKSLGSYNWAKLEEKQYQVSVRLGGDLAERAPGKVLSFLFDEDEDPDVDGVAPSEVAEMIWAKASRWFYTKKAEDEKLASWIAENAAEVDAAWARGEIEGLRRQIASLEEYLPEGSEA